MIEVEKRQFKGVVNNKSACDKLDKDERKLNKAALRAYLKGHKTFRHGYEGAGATRMPKIYVTPMQIRVLADDKEIKSV